jgi:hypothetical protein
VIAARLLPLALLGPCLLACSTTPRRAAAPPPADATARDPASSATLPASADAAPKDTSVPETSGDPAPWIEPLPPLTLGELTDDQQSRSRACLDDHDVRSPSAAAASIMAAAECLAAIPTPGQEIRLYRLLVESHPAAPEALEATRRLGTRYEQLDLRAEAAAAYGAYLRRYPKQDDARGLGQRAVCLARSLGPGTHVDDLLAELERLYGRRGFIRPTEDELARSCALLPPVAPRSR